jgi:membrane protein implicated in regulation of membrane protease activity
MTHWEVLIALIVAVPLILFPAAYVWYLNVSSIYAAIKRMASRRAARQKEKSGGIGERVRPGAGKTG